MSWANGPVLFFELAKLDLVPGNPSKSGINCGIVGKKNKKQSGQKKKKSAVLNNNAWTERCRDLTKTNKQNGKKITRKLLMFGQSYLPRSYNVLARTTFR